MTRVTSSPRRAKSADRIDGAIRYTGHPLTALALGPFGRVIAQAVALRAAAVFLAQQREAGLFVGPVDDEAHGNALHSARGVEGHQADVVLREALPAAIQLEQHPCGILQIEHRHAEHFPVGIARVRIVAVLDAPGVAALEAVLDLQRDFRVRQLGEKAELALRDLAYRIAHHWVCSLAVSAPRRPWACSRTHPSGCS